MNWAGDRTLPEIQETLKNFKTNRAKSLLKSEAPEFLPKRFWLNLLRKCKVSFDKQWANLTKKELNLIANTLVFSQFQIVGQNRFKDEFVECGGVTSSEIDFRTMESKVFKGVYFAGEILDVDGITGGFNFQNAWTTGWLAANGIFDY